MGGVRPGVYRPGLGAGRPRVLRRQRSADSRGHCARVHLERLAVVDCVAKTRLSEDEAGFHLTVYALTRICFVGYAKPWNLRSQSLRSRTAARSCEIGRASCRERV